MVYNPSLNYWVKQWFKDEVNPPNFVMMYIKDGKVKYCGMYDHLLLTT